MRLYLSIRVLSGVIINMLGSEVVLGSRYWVLEQIGEGEADTEYWILNTGWREY